jgi:glyoxalase superfamily protein
LSHASDVTTFGLVLDCADPVILADFWSGALGYVTRARRLSEAMSEHGSTWVLMEDPEGNEFCVCDGGAPGP